MPKNNLFDMKKRIKASEQTHKITRTMELIASSRLQRGKVQLAAAAAWLGHIRNAAQLLPESYFAPRPDPIGRNAYIIFGGSKGLSGAYGPNLQRYAAPIVQGHTVIAIGSAKMFPDAVHQLGADSPSVDFTQAIIEAAKHVYDDGEADEVNIVYQRGAAHVTERLFPPPHVEPTNGDAEGVIFEPSDTALFPALLAEYTAAIVYEAHLQAYMAEQIARVSAMDNASKNAEEIIDNLRAVYNRIRQSTITQEIIATGNAAKGR